MWDAMVEHCRSVEYGIWNMEKKRQNARKISKDKNLKLIFRFNVSDFSVDEHDKMQSLRLL